MSTTTAPLKRIGLIIGSTRQPRVGPSIASLLARTIDSTPHPTSTLSIIDISTFSLPLLDEPAPAMSITNPSDYVHEHTRNWSTTISSFDGFIFVSPQYNWSIPAALKNALDYLYHEWTGKPAFVVSYGGRGGDKGGEALTNVLHALRMKVVEAEGGVQLALGPLEDGVKMSIQGVLVDEAEVKWEKQLALVREGFEKLVKEAEAEAEKE